MSRILEMLTAATMLLALAACQKNESSGDSDFQQVGLIDQIRITEITGNHPAISEIALVARFHVPAQVLPGPASEFSQVLLRIPFNPQETRLELPENPPQGLLRNITREIPEGFTISDTDANTISFVEIVCDMGTDNRVRNTLYLYRTDQKTNYQLTYIYCDRPVTITGTGHDWWGHPTTYDLHLKRGWNCAVEKESYDNGQTQTITNWMPSGMQWKYGTWI